MAIDYNLEDVDQESFAVAEAQIIDLLRESAPSMDLRRGTAIRDLLVRPAAQFHALNDTRISDLINTYSLTQMQANPQLADDDIADGILSNMAYNRQIGSKSQGVAAFYVNTLKDYSIPSGYLVEDSDQYRFKTTQSWTARAGTVDDASSEVAIIPIDSPYGSYMFLIPMEAVDVGIGYDVQEGETLRPALQQLTGVVTIEAYTGFTGGADEETVTEAITNLSSSLSHRAFESQNSISAKLRDNFSNVYAVSAVGYANEAQLRDKHNLFGVAAGSKVDIYVRTFRAPYSELKTVNGAKVSDGVYQFTMPRSLIPGFYRVRSVSAIGSTVEGVVLEAQPTVASLPFTVEREATGLTDTYHDFGSDNADIETSFSIYQQAVVTVTDVPAFTQDGAPVYPASVTFKVEVYLPPNLEDIQTLIDSDTVRNQEADIVARGAVPCLVTLSATVYRRPDASVDLDQMAIDLANYVNNKDFGEVLTVSQLTDVMHGYNIERVSLDDKSSIGLKLQGEIIAADGSLIEIAGDALDIDTVENPALLVSTDTVIYALDQRNIFLNEVVTNV